MLSVLKTNIKTFMERTVLKASLRHVIIKEQALVNKIAIATGKSAESVKRWVRTNSSLLLLSPCLDEIRSHLKLSKSEILTETITDSSKELAA